VSSFAVTILFLVLKKTGHAQPFAHTVIYSVALTTLCWLVTAFVTQPTARGTLVAFYRKVRPAGPGWAAVRAEAGPEGGPRDHMGLATLGWVAGCAMIWSSLFAIGNFLYGRTGTAWILTAVFVVSSGAVIYTMNHLWESADKN
jgi:SSS family solute:Na+ symporter